MRRSTSLATDSPRACDSAHRGPFHHPANCVQIYFVGLNVSPSELVSGNEVEPSLTVECNASVNESRASSPVDAT